MATEGLYQISIPNAQFSPAIYPSSPIAQFPPPLPALRPSLRERCGFTHTLKIKTTFSQQHARAGPWSPKGHLQPHRNNLPRRRKGQIKRIVLIDDDSPADIKPELTLEPKAALPEYDVPPTTEKRHLQEVVPGLFVAFKLSDEAAGTRDAQDEGYTHIIDICYPLPGYDSGATEQAYEGHLHRLRLVLPATARPVGSQRANLALNDAQLRAARDFLAQTLPYTATSKRENSPQTAPSGVRVLISTPMRRPTDAMSIAGCYLAFVSGKSVETALHFFDEEEDFLSIWKGEVSDDEAQRVEHVARMWSWLTRVRR